MLSSRQLKGWQPVLRTVRGFQRAPSAPGVVCLLLAGSTLASYWPVLSCGFISLDDPTYFSDNAQVLGGLSWASVFWAFRSYYASNWHPLAWLSHMLDAEVFGKGAMGPHGVNLLFHIANALLLFFLLRKMTGAHWRSAFVAGLFALHPLHVESVAWISERKDVLSTFFGMLSLLAYARHVQESGVASLKSKAWYWLALACYSLGLMSKPMLVTLPFVMLLLDYWPLQRFRPSHLPRLLWEKTPFMLMSAASSVVTVLAQKAAMASIIRLSMHQRVVNATVSYARYLGKTFWPLELALPYPHPGIWPVEEIALAAALTGAISVGAVLAARRFPFAFTGWFWFCGMLVPVIGLIQVGVQSMADRYTYMPLIGLFLVLVWGLAAAAARWRVPGPAVGMAAATVLVLCGIRTHQQVGLWHDSERLFRHALAVTKDNSVALNVMGIALAQQGRLDEAVKYYRWSLQLQPTDADAHFNLGNALVDQRQYAEAVASFEATLSLKPEYYEARNNLANTLVKLGRPGQAAEQYRLALKQQPDAARIHVNLAAILAGQGDYGAAALHYRRALKEMGDDAGIHYALGLALAMQGRWDEAIAHYNQTLRHWPDNPEAHYNLGYALRRSGRFPEAALHLGEALRLRPDFALAHYNLACVLADKNRPAEATAHLREALRLQPDYPEAKQKLRELGAQGLN
jgi:tetratricopeptide (TPR) repeat protein